MGPPDLFGSFLHFLFCIDVCLCVFVKVGLGRGHGFDFGRCLGLNHVLVFVILTSKLYLGLSPEVCSTRLGFSKKSPRWRRPSRIEMKILGYGKVPHTITC